MTADMMKSSSPQLRSRMVSFLVVAFVAMYFPWIVTTIFLVIDFITPINVMSSPIFDIYHKTVTSFLSEKPETPLPELVFTGENAISWDNVTEEVYRASRGLRYPVVLRQAGITDPKYEDKEFWKEQYGDEDVICAPVVRKSKETKAVESFCTIKHFLESPIEDKLYVAGASSIFSRRPELSSMVETAGGKPVTDQELVARQIFMGWGGQGSETHAAVGMNIFHQITGRKRWYFFPPSETPYLKPSMNNNPFSAMTRTIAQNPPDKVSPYVKKLHRYVVTLEPGDMLLNPSWFWHSVFNLGTSDDLVIGCPTRHNGSPQVAMKNNAVFSIFSMFWTFARKGGPVAFSKLMKGGLDENGRDAFEKMLAENRILR